MKEERLKTRIMKIGIALLIMMSALAANITSAHASLEPLIFRNDTNLVEFTHKLIYRKLYSQSKSSFDRNKDNKGNSREFWIRINTLVKRLERNQ